MDPNNPNPTSNPPVPTDINNQTSVQSPFSPIEPAPLQATTPSAFTPPSDPQPVAQAQSSLGNPWDGTLSATHPVEPSPMEPTIPPVVAAAEPPFSQPIPEAPAAPSPDLSYSASAPLAAPEPIPVPSLAPNEPISPFNPSDQSFSQPPASIPSFNDPLTPPIPSAPASPDPLQPELSTSAPEPAYTPAGDSFTPPSNALASLPLQENQTFPPTDSQQSTFDATSPLPLTPPEPTTDSTQELNPETLPQMPSNPLEPAPFSAPVATEPIPSTDTSSLSDLGLGVSINPQAHEPTVLQENPLQFTPPQEPTLEPQVAEAPHLEPSEPAPTDLSQLSGLGAESSNSYTPPVSNPETLVIPPTSPIPESLNQAEEKHHRLPKPLLFGGIAVILLVVLVSAYFFFGRSTTPPPSSLPAQTSQQLPLTNPPQPIPSPSKEALNNASPSAQADQGTNGFGSFNPGGASPSGESAFDALKARQATTQSSSSATAQ